MTTTEHDQPSPEQARKKPVYERTLRPNYSGVLDHAAEAALVWSSLKAGLRDTDDPSEKRSFQNQLKIIETWNPEDDFYAHLENVREEAQLVVDGPNPGSYMGMSARRRLDALAGIMGDIRAQDARLKQASEGLGAVDVRKKRSELINLWIDEHNLVVNTVNAPETQSAETLDTSPENKEKVLGVLDRVVEAAKDHTYIHTDTRPIPVRHGREMRETERTGFQTFGDAPDVRDVWGPDMLRDSATAEAVIFQPVTKKTYETKTDVVKKRLFGKKQTVERQVPNGEVPVMVTNRATGEKEPGVKVAYQFNANGVHYTNLPRYDTLSGRPGNVLIINTVLPRSVAEAFKQTVQDNPLAARAFAEAVMFNNGVTEEAWTSDKAPMRPPYDQLPSDWKMSIIDVDAGHRPQKGVDATRYQEVPVTTS